MALQHFAHLGEQRLPKMVLLEKPAKLQQRRRIRNALATQVDAYEAAQAGAVIQRLFAGLVSQIEPVLHEQHAQHPLQSDGRAPTFALGVVRQHHHTKLLPGRDLVHQAEEHVGS